MIIFISELSKYLMFRPETLILNPTPNVTPGIFVSSCIQNTMVCSNKRILESELDVEPDIGTYIVPFGTPFNSKSAEK